MPDVTQILNAIEQGDPSASSKLLPLVYEELRVLARQRMANEKPGHTLQATGLVHEAYLRLVGSNAEQPAWNSRGHFFGAAAEAMRRILVENARAKQSEKRGGDRIRRDLDRVEIPIPEDSGELLALNEALEKLAITDARTAELVKLRYFAGMTNREAAEVLGVSARSATEYWAYAKAWILREIEHAA